MKAQLIELLACTVCRQPLKFEGEQSDGRLVNGLLHCSNSHFYPVKDEIPVLKDPKTSRKEFVWKVEFPNLAKYDEIRKQYGSHLEAEQKQADRRLLNRMAEAISNERIVLDLASGMGTLLRELSKKAHSGQNLLGTDVDEKPLRGVKLKLEAEGSYEPTSLAVMDSKHLTLADEKIPCATSFFGFNNIAKPREAFREVFRALMPEGRLVFSSLGLRKDSRSLKLADELGYGDIATGARLTQTLEDTGFKIDSAKEYYSGVWPQNPMDRIPIAGDWFQHQLIRAHKR